MRFIIVFSLIFISSCALVKKKKTTYDISGKIEIHKPYCGGAKPNEEQLKGYFEPYANATFVVKTKMNHDLKEETVLQFRTDADGNYTFKIPAGNFIVVHEDKLLSFENYILKLGKSTDRFLEYIGDKDAKFQYDHLDYNLDIQENKTFNYAYKSRCFSGINPLLRYNGPKPR